MPKSLKKYRYLLVIGSIFILPLLFYVLLNLGKHQYTRLAYYSYGKNTTDLENAYTLENISFTDSEDKIFKTQDIEGKISLWGTIHTRDYLLSPALIANLQFLQDRFKDYPDIVFVSLITNSSNPPEKQDYIKTLNINTKNWKVLSAADSIRVRDFVEKKLFVPYKNLPDSLATMLVPSNFVVLVDKNRHIRGYFDGATHKEVKGKLLDAIDMLIREEFVIYKNSKK